MESMGANTKIEWCDHTAQFWEGCVKVAPGCQHCYAERMSRRWGRDIWGKRKPRKWTKGGPDLIRHLNRKAAKAGRVDTVFVNDHADFFEEHDGPVIDHEGNYVHRDPNTGRIFTDPVLAIGRSRLTIADLREHAFPLFDECQSLIFILLTKRPENIRRMWPTQDKTIAYFNGPHPVAQGYYRPNVWLLTSVATQADADRNIPELLACRDLAPVLGVSAEPLVGPIDLGETIDRLDWVIAGGESGPTPRPMHPAWARSLRDQCAAAGVPFFFKQWGGWQPLAEVDRAGTHVTARIAADGREVDPLRGERRDSDVVMARVGKRAAGRLLDGELYHEFPAADCGA